MDTLKSISDLKPDGRNARKHNPRNIDMIERSLQEVGAARSIVIDEDDNVLAGNGTIEAAGNVGIEKVRIVEADGNEIIAVKRKGLTPEQKQKLAMYDNRTGELAEWDSEILRSLDVGLNDFFTDEEQEALGVYELPKKEADEKDIVAFKQTHVLLSFPPDKFIEVQDMLEQLSKIKGMEIAQSSN